MSNITQPLFHDSVYDAIGTAVHAIDGPKKVAKQLWPTLGDETAYTRLMHCLNEKKSEKLDPDELLFLMRAARKKGNHSIIEYLARECGYKVEPIEPEDEKAALQRQFINAVREVKALGAQLEQKFGVSVLRSAG